MRLRIPKAEVVRILLEWHERLGAAIPALADTLERGPEAFSAAFDSYTRESMAEVAHALECAADDGPRAA